MTSTGSDGVEGGEGPLAELIRVALKEALRLSLTPGGRTNRELAAVITKFQEAEMWNDCRVERRARRKLLRTGRLADIEAQAASVELF